MTLIDSKPRPVPHSDSSSETSREICASGGSLGLLGHSWRPQTRHTSYLSVYTTVDGELNVSKHIHERQQKTTLERGNKMSKRHTRS